MNIRCIIVDDEIDACQALEALLTKYIPNVQVLDIANSVDEAIEKIKLHQPDVVFLDIEMPNGNGFTLFERIKNVDFEVVFATAYDQYAIKAIKYSALDYLLKPYDLRELKSAISKLMEKKQFEFSQKRIEVLLENISGPGSFDKVAFPTQDGYVYLNVNNIVRCLADGNYTEIYLFNSQKYIISKKLKEIEELLPEDKFFRIHRSSLINIAYVSRYKRSEGFQVFMDDGSVLDISHRRKEEFLAKMKHK